MGQQRHRRAVLPVSTAAPASWREGRVLAARHEPSAAEGDMPKRGTRDPLLNLVRGIGDVASAVPHRRACGAKTTSNWRPVIWPLAAKGGGGYSGLRSCLNAAPL